MSDPKPNIAIIVPGGVGTGKDNIGIPILERIIKLLAVDFEVTVFELYKVNEKYEAEGFELIEAHSSNRIIKLIKFLFIFYKIRKHRKFKVLHGFWAFPCGFLAVLAGRIFHIRSIVSLQGGDAISLPEIKYGQLQKWIPKKLVLWTLHHADEVISPTKYLVNNLRKFGLNREHIKCIPLGVDTGLFKFQNKSIGNPVQFLHVANFHPVKDQVTLLKAFQIISNRLSCQLTIIGEGMWKKKIKSLAAELNIDQRISFREPMPYESLPPFYHRADILLHSSVSEGQAMVVLEAMSCGVLVCGTRVGLLYDLPECSVVVPIGDHESLARETLKLISDPERMNTVRQRAYHWAAEHTTTWTAEKIQESYNY